MKHFLTYCLSAYFALFVTVAGSGFSMVYFCCSECHNAGIGHVISGSCDRLHHARHQHDATCHHHGNCQFIHYSVAKMLLSHQADLPASMQIELINAGDYMSHLFLLADAALQVFCEHYSPPRLLTGRLLQTSVCRFLL